MVTHAKSLARLSGAVIGTVAAVIAAAALSRATWGATITWLPDADGNWSTKADWSGGNLPRNTDDVVIDVGGATVRTITHSAGTDSVLTLFSNENVVLSGGQLTLASLAGTAMSTINADFTVSGGTLFGSGDLTVNGALNWNAGAISGGGTAIVASTASLNIDTSAAIVTLSRIMENDSTAASWTGTSNFVFSGGTFNNIATAVFTTSANASMANTGGNNNFNNAGTFNRTGAGTTTIVVTFNNTGTVNVQGGTLALSGGGDNTGLLNMASGAALNVTLGTYVFDTGTVVSGPGTLGLSGGILSIAQPSTVNAPWTISGGTISGVADIIANGAVTWTGGTMTSTGTTVIAPTGSLNINTSASTITLGRPLQNNGTVNWLTGSNNIGFSGGTFNNAAGAVFTTSAVASMVTVAGGNAFNNAGTFNRTGTGTTTIAIEFNNSGTVNVQSGALNLTGGGAQTAPISISDGAGLSLNGTHTFSAAATVTAAGTGTLDILGGASTFDGVVGVGGALGVHAGTASFNAAVSAASLAISGGTTNFNSTGSFSSASLSTGTLSGAGDMTVSGAMNWTNGTMSGVGKTKIASTGSLSVTTAATGLTLSRVLENNGTASWASSGTFGINFASGTFNNQPGAMFNAAATTALNNTSGTNAFNNAGTFNQTAAGTTTIAIPFNNSATVNVQGGTLVLSGGGNNTGSFNIAPATTMNVTAGTYIFNTGTVVSGTGILGLTGGTLSIAQASAVNSPWTISGGTLGGVGDVTANGVLNWSGGTMSGTGKTIVGAVGLLNFNTAASVTLSRILENDGTMNWAAGTSNILFSGGTLNNQPGATFTTSVAGSMINNAVGNAFNNAGTYSESGAGTFTVAVPLNNTGTINVQSGTLSLTGSVVQVAGPTLTGGSWNISNAATLNIPLTTLTSNAASITLDGPTSSFVAINNLTINSGGFTVTNGRTFTTTGGFTNSGTLTVGSGSTFTMAAVQPYNQTAGVTNLQGGALTAAAGINISGGSLVGSGAINGNLNVGGMLSPGNSAGSISVAGNLNLGGAAQSLFELGGTAAGTFDTVSASGSAILAGTLGLSFINGFQTSIRGSDTFTILTSGSPLSGAFSNVANGGRLATTDGFGKFRVVYSGNSMVLSDFNTVRWVPDADGDWATAANWSSTPGLPSSTDDVLIDVGGATVRTITHSVGTDSIKSLTSSEAVVVSGGSLSIAGASTIANSLAVSSGTLSTDSALTVAGNVTWSGGTLNGIGALNANGGMTLNGAQVVLSQTTVNNAGVATWNSGRVSTGNGAIFNNLAIATFNDTFDGTFAFDQGGTLSVFNNAGTFSKTAGSGTTTFSTAFNNTGTVNVQSGTLSLSGGGTDTGPFNLAPGTALNFSGGTHTLNAGAVVSGPAASLTLGSGTVTINESVNVGNLNLAGATASFNGAFANAGALTSSGGATTFGHASTISSVGSSITIIGGAVNFSSASALSTSSLSISSGTLGGSSALTVSGNTTVSGGTLSGSGTLNANGGMTLNGVQSIFSQRTVNNAGVATWSSGLISTGNGAIFDNLATATFNNTFDGTFAFDQGGTPSVFINAGTFSKTAGTGTTTFSTAFNNTGTVNVQSGTLSLTGPVPQISGSAFTGGTWNISGISTLSIPGASITSSAASVTLDGPGASFPAFNSLASNSGALTITGGRTFTTTNAFTNSGALTLSSGSTLTTAAGQAYSQITGTTSLQGGTLASSGGVSIAGGSLAGSGSISGNLSLGGTLSPGNSAGSIAVSGNLSLSGTAQSLFELGGTAAGSFDTVNVTGSATLGGTLGVSFINAFQSSVKNSDTFTILNSAAPISGTFSNAASGARLKTSGAPGTLLVSYNGSSVVLSSFVAGTAWLPNADGDWSATGNWSTAPALPGAADDVTLDVGGGTVRTITHSAGTDAINSLNSQENLVLSGGSLSLAQASQINGSLMLSATLAGTGNVTVSSLDWQGGLMSGSGHTLIPAGATLSISSPGSKTLSRVIDNSGTASYTGGTLNFDGGTFNNNTGATFNTAIAGALSSAAGSNAFNNAGTFNKSTGTSFDINIPFSNSGTVSIQGGSLNFDAGGINSGLINVTAGAAASFTGSYTNAAASSITGAGAVNFTGGVQDFSGQLLASGPVAIATTVNFNTAQNFIGPLSVTGKLSGTGNVTAASSLAWTGGSMSGAGHTIIPAGTTLTIGGAGSTALSRVLDNSGTATYTGGTITFNGGTFNNNLGASFSTSAAGTLGNGGGVNAFSNAGTFTKTGATSFDVNVPFSNGGSVSVQGGTLNLNGAIPQISGSALSGGTWNISGISTLNIPGASITSSAASVTLDGPGASFPAINSLASNSGSLTITNGHTFAMAGAFANSGTIQLAGATSLITGGAITNSATIIGQGSIANAVTNNGGGDIEAAGGILSIGGVLTNPGGLIVVNSGAELLVSQGLTANSGAIDLVGGTFDNNGASLNNAGQISGWGVFRTGNAGLDNNGSITFSGGLTTINGPVTNENGKTITIAENPAIFTGMITNNVGGTLNAVNTTATFAGGFTNNGNSNFAKAGGGTVEMTAAPTLNNGSTLSVTAGTLRFNVVTGTPTIGTGVTATISSGATLELAGTVPALANGSNRASIVNNSGAPGVLVSGIHQQVGNIDGSGNTQVNAGSDLTANRIIQGALVVGGTAGGHGLVTIDASDASGNPLGQSSGLALADSLTPSGPFGAGGISSANLSSGADGGTDLTGLSLGNSPGGSNPSSVPEPSTLLLALLAVLGVVSTQFTRHHFRCQTV